MQQQIKLFQGTANVKKVNIFLSLVTFLLLLFCSFSCRQEIADDEDVFKSFEPLEWSDDYVFAATNTPHSIQVWDSKTKKLVRVYKFYDLEDGNRYFDIMYADYLDKAIWFVGCRKRSNLIRLDIETGKLDFIKTDFIVTGIQAIPADIDGKGTLWVCSSGTIKSGKQFACYNTDGSLRDSFRISDSRASYCELGVIYSEGKYYQFSVKDTDLNNYEKEQDVVCMINLTDREVLPLSFSDFFSNEFIERELGISDKIKFISNFTVQTTAEKFYLCTTLTSSIKDLSVRFLRSIESINPLRTNYLNIKWNDRRFNEFAENSNSYFAIGRPIYADYYGVEIGVYSKDGGAQEKYAQLPSGNQLFVQTKDGKTWISRDACNYGNDRDGLTIVTEMLSSPKIYMLEHESGNVYEISADGSSVLVDYINGEADYIKIP